MPHDYLDKTYAVVLFSSSLHIVVYISDIFIVIMHLLTLAEFNVITRYENNTRNVENRGYAPIIRKAFSGGETMIASKFGIGQQVRHSLLGYLGVVVDIDPVYSLNEPLHDGLSVDESLNHAPWYHVVMEDQNGQTVHTYLPEIQIRGEILDEHPEQPSLDELAHSIRQQLQSPRLRN